MEDVFQIPSFINAHSHAFQRALRGRVEGGDFWAWRDAMLELARGQTPGGVRTDYADSNVRIDPLEELRELDGIARRQAGRRDVFTVNALLSIGSSEGAASLGLEHWPAIRVDASHPQLRGVEEPLAALVAGCSADVVLGRG